MQTHPHDFSNRRDEHGEKVFRALSPQFVPAALGLGSVLVAGGPERGVGGRRTRRGLNGSPGRTSCHDDKVALAACVCWLMKSLFARLSNQMAEQRVQHEEERTRLEQQHSAEKDSLVQERQREVLSLERQAKATLQQHQQHTQEWRKRDGQVGGPH